MRKKLKEIEMIKEKDASTLEKDQIEKMNREHEILTQIDELAKQIGES